MSILISGRIYYIMPLFNPRAGLLPGSGVLQEIGAFGFVFPGKGVFHVASKTSGTEKPFQKNEQ